MAVQYNPESNHFNRKGLKNAKDENVPQTFARLVDPPCTLRTTGWNRWQPLFHDPQKTFEQPFDYFEQSLGESDIAECDQIKLAMKSTLFKILV